MDHKKHYIYNEKEKSDFNSFGDTITCISPRHIFEIPLAVTLNFEKYALPYDEKFTNVDSDFPSLFS